MHSHTLYGTLNLLILKTVAREPRHGLSILRAIQSATNNSLRIEEGALYPALHRLERDGLLKSEWGRSENKRRAKFYRLTAKGKRSLEREVESWVQHALAVGAVLGVDWTLARA